MVVSRNGRKMVNIYDKWKLQKLWSLSYLGPKNHNIVSLNSLAPCPQRVFQFITSKSFVCITHTSQYSSAISAFWCVSGISIVVTAWNKSLNKSRKALGLVNSRASAEAAISFETFMKLLSFTSAI